MSRAGNPVGERGFTLIELATVVLVIGVVATIAIPSFLSIGDRGHDAAARTGVRSMSRVHSGTQEEGSQATTIEALEAIGFTRSPSIEYGLCADPAGVTAAFAARHVESDLVWLVVGQGRLVEVRAEDVTAALVARAECPDADAIDTAA